MYFLFIVLILCFLLFLFSLYLLSRDDFVFVRHDISQEEIFNAAFLTGLVSLFTARLFYVLFHPSPSFLNPLVFLLFPYFPGLSVAGGLIGGVLFLNLYVKRRKMPLGRLADFFATSLLVATPFAYLGFFILGGFNIVLFFELILFVLTLIAVLFFSPRLYRKNIKDGSISLAVLIVVFFIFFIGRLIQAWQEKIFILNFENIFITLSMLIFSAFFFRQEIIRKLKKS